MRNLKLFLIIIVLLSLIVSILSLNGCKTTTAAETTAAGNTEAATREKSRSRPNEAVTGLPLADYPDSNRFVGFSCLAQEAYSQLSGPAGAGLC